MADKAAKITMDARRSVQALAQDAREELTVDVSVSLVAAVKDGDHAES
jgi:hypothetical protein